MINTNQILTHGGEAEFENQSAGVNSESIDEIVSRYEVFVDVVCTGARFGTSEALEDKFFRSRSFLLPQLSRIAQLLAQCHSGDANKIAQLLENLLASSSLVHLLDEDDGSLIPRLTWISQALFDVGTSATIS